MTRTIRRSHNKNIKEPGHHSRKEKNTSKRYFQGKKNYQPMELYHYAFLQPNSFRKGNKYR
jgi:hypothetical protein